MEGLTGAGALLEAMLVELLVEEVVKGRAHQAMVAEEQMAVAATANSSRLPAQKLEAHGMGGWMDGCVSSLLPSCLR